MTPTIEPEMEEAELPVTDAGVVELDPDPVPVGVAVVKRVLFPDPDPEFPTDPSGFAGSWGLLSQSHFLKIFMVD